MNHGKGKMCPGCPAETPIYQIFHDCHDILSYLKHFVICRVKHPRHPLQSSPPFSRPAMETHSLKTFQKPPTAEVPCKKEWK